MTAEQQLVERFQHIQNGAPVDETGDIVLLIEAVVSLTTRLERERNLAIDEAQRWKETAMRMAGP